MPEPDRCGQHENVAGQQLVAQRRPFVTATHIRFHARCDRVVHAAQRFGLDAEATKLVADVLGDQLAA
jgi:hypothetical protein